MRSVYLYGHLAEQFGPEFRLEVFSVAEAVRALEANFPGRFVQAIAQGDYHLIKGDDIETGESLGEELISFGLGAHDLHIMPALAGSKSGVFTFVVGVVLIIAAFYTAGASAGAAYGLMEGVAAGSMTATTFMGVTMASYAAFGAAMAFNGLNAILSPTMKLSGTSGTRAAVDPRASFVFQGAENISSQGGPVPVIYGRPGRVGSTVIAASITVEDIAV